MNHPHSDCSDSDDICIAALRSKRVTGSNEENLKNESATVVPLVFQQHSINNITFKSSPVPGLIEDDSNVHYCNMNNLPDHCNATSVCQCTHLINLELCEVYEFILINDGRKNKNIDVKY